jgi:hypothetical protein
MKLSRLTRSGDGGYTLADIMVATALVTIVGVITLYALNSGTILYSKNTAENLAHDQSRIAVNRLLHDIHTAVSIPSVGYIVAGADPSPSPGCWVPYGTNVTFRTQTPASTTIASGSNGASLPQAAINVASTTGFPSPSGTILVTTANGGQTVKYTGVTSNSFTGCSLTGLGAMSTGGMVISEHVGMSFQLMGGPGDPNGGPFNVKNDPGNPELIMIQSYTSTPKVGMRLIFPYYNMEDDIVKATSNGADHYNIWTKNALETRFKTKKNTYYICYYTTRWAYAVQNNKLNLYSSAPPPAGFTWPVTVARNISSDAPFSQSTTQYVGINTLLAGSVPYRAQLCVNQ